MQKLGNYEASCHQKTDLVKQSSENQAKRWTGFKNKSCFKNVSYLKEGIM